MTTIKIKRSAVTGSVPADGVLETGELAVNIVDGKMFTGDSAKRTVKLSSYLPEPPTGDGEYKLKIVGGVATWEII